MAEAKVAIDVPKTNQIQLRHLNDSLSLLYAAQREPAMIWGAPGLAKSAHASKFADDMKLPFYDIRLAHFDPIDFKGIPYVDEITIPEGLDVPIEMIVEDDGGKVRKCRVTRFAPPELLPMRPAIMCLEELPNALPSIQIVASRIILDRTMDGGWKADKRTMMIATGNRRSDRSGANALLQNLDNRMIHFEVQPDLDYWLDWLLGTYAVDEAGKEAVQGIISFLKFMPQMSHKFDASSSYTDSHGFPTYRSWHKVANIMQAAVATKRGTSDLITRSCVAGAIGIAACEQYYKFLDIQAHLPNVDEILATSKSFDIPDKLDILYAFIGAIAYRTNAKNQERVWEIVDQFEAKDKGDWAVLLVRMAGKFCSEFADNDKLGDFVHKHRYVMGLQ